jgi:signal peptidase I
MAENSGTFLKRSELLQLVLFVGGVIIGVLLINAFIFQSFTVNGRSMETTLFGGDRLIVNRVPVTVATIQNKQYLPDRGQIIVFKNPNYLDGAGDEYIVKRVIAFGGERVKLQDGHYTVYNAQHPTGFNPDTTDKNQPGSPTVGDINVTVPDGSLFVSGDHRQLDPASRQPFSLDSRNGLGYVPLYDIVGPVSVRIFPFTKIDTF